MGERPNTRRVSEAAIGEGDFAYRFGEVAVVMGLLTRPQVEAALESQKQLKEQNQLVQIGQLMVEKGTLSPSQVTAILIAQKRYRKDHPQFDPAAGGTPSAAKAPTEPASTTKVAEARAARETNKTAQPGSTATVPGVQPKADSSVAIQPAKRGSTANVPQAPSAAPVAAAKPAAAVPPPPVPAAAPAKPAPAAPPAAPAAAAPQAPPVPNAQQAKPHAAPAEAPSAAAADDEPAVPEPAPEIHQPPPGAGTGVYKKFAQFELIRRIGEGSMGALFETWDTQRQLRLALKVLPKKLAADKEFFQRFKREINTLSTLNHPNIVKFYGAGEHQGYTYYCMEFIDGESLQKRIDHEDRLPQSESLRICGDIARALSHAHSKGVIHRDIKPENVLLSKKGDVKVTDFGLAKSRDEESKLTVAGTSIGTPYDLSPEQAMGLTDIDQRADLYSLGVTMYHLLTGKLPFDAKSSTQVMMMHVEAQPPDPRGINPGLSRGLCQVILKLMEKEPKNRYSSADSIVDVVDRLLNFKPPEEKETIVQPGAATKKMTFKQFALKLIFSKAGLALIAVIGLLIAAFWWINRLPPPE